MKLVRIFITSWRTKYSGLYDRSSIHYNDFAVYLEQVYNEVNPPIYGVTFISGALSNNIPVSTLNATFFSNLPWHWVTITELNVYSPTTVYTTISNMGSKET